jgi:hypothetical protein
MIDRLQHFLRAGLFCSVVALGSGTVQGAVPQLLNHQGRVAVNGVNFDGNGQFKFALVNATGSNTYWSNNGSSSAGSEPTSHVTLPVAKGLYSVLLGDTTLTNMTALLPSALDYDVVRLRIWFNDGTKGFQLITPDQRLAAAPYALLASKATSATGFDGQLAGEVTGFQSNTTISTAAVTGKALTGYSSATGEILATDTILGAINKLNGNTALKANLAGAAFTGPVTGITKLMVGLGNVTDTSDADKPVSTLQQTALNAKANLTGATFTGTVNGITASMVGLGNVNNTLDSAKPVSAAQQTALDLKANLASPTFTGTVGGITATMVGLGNVNNTLDSAKPVSTAQQTALDLKANLASPTFTGSVQLPSGTLTAAPLKFVGGTKLTTLVFGAVEFDGTNLYLTNNSGSLTRKTIAFTDSTIANGAVGTSQLASGLTLAGTTTGTFSGNVTGNVSGNVSGSAASFTGSLGGDVTGTQGFTSIAAATVTGKALTSLNSTAGTISATDTILSAIGKLNGNDGLKANLASPTFTGTVTLPAGSSTAAPLRLSAGTNLTAATLGSVEFDGNNLYLTTNAASPTRKTVALSDTGTSSQIALSSVVAAPIYPVVAWGSNSQGQTRPPVLANVAAVAAGDSHSIALLDDGQVVEWGLSVGTKPTLTGVTDIAAGGSHNLVRQSNGRVLAWGNNAYGQATAPTDIVTAVKVAAGARHSLALLTNGTVRGWGESYLGKNAAPASLTGMTVIAIAAGENHSLALKSTGAVVAWGDNAALQTTVPSEALSGVTAIAAGWNHSLALKSTGAVIAWGDNRGGQTTVPAAASSGVVQIAAGDTYSMALKADGTIVTWGFTAAVTVVPDGTTQVTQIAAGGYHALALRADTVPVELARLDSAGRLGIGRTAATNALEVEGNASKSTAGDWLANSDRRIKTDIESITGALEKLDQVRLVDFRYTDDYLAAHPGIEDRRYPNVIAQEFQQVFPDDVKSSGETLPDGSPILQVDTYPLTIYSAAAVQELHRENQALKQQLADQDARLRKLEAILENR